MTFLENGRPAPREKDDILDDLISSAEDAFGREFTPNEVSVIRAFYDPVAEYAAGQQDDLAEAVNASQIDYAEGDALGLLSALIGVSRLQAQPASMRLQFRHDGRVTRDYPIPQGTQAQTDSAEPVVFESDDATVLPLLDDFGGDLSAYDGDTGSFSIQSSTVSQGSNALEAPASSATIVNPDETFEEGSRIYYDTHINTGTSSDFLFAAQNTDNFYALRLDEGAGNVELLSVESGTGSTVGSASASIPTGEFLTVRIDWQHNGNFDILVEDSSESEVVSFEASESDVSYQEGGFGFRSADSNDVKYFDFAALSRISVDATATEPGSETNVGAGVVTVLADSVSGVDTVTNPLASSGGRDREPDEDLRERAKTELSTAMRATLPALINRIRALDGVNAVTVIDNDTNSQDSDGRPGHSFEAVVDANSQVHEDVAETILDTKAVGDTSVGGYGGSAVTVTLELVNGQSKDITFSEPTPVTIYVDADLQVTDVYAGDEQVRDNIVQYVGGELTSGNTVGGELNFRDDVIYNQVVEAVMNTAGVHDINSLTVGTSDSPTGTSNVSISDTELATTVADNATLGVTTTEI